jgi:hypothetical protein
MTRPFVVAPWIEEASIRYWGTDSDATGLLRQNGMTPASVLQNFLDSLQPEGKHPTIRLGYTLGINVYDLYSQSAGGWAFDISKMEFFLQFMREVGRPVVIALRANHFVGESGLAKDLANEECNLARVSDGSIMRETYFTNTTIAPIFSLDEGIPINRYRFGGFRTACEMIGAFDRKHTGLLQALTLAGELHHFVPRIEDPSSAGWKDGPVKWTDYSDSSLADFRVWLRANHGDLAKLNQKFQTPFRTWEEVVPPSKDLRAQPSLPLWMHLDSVCAGGLPVVGWADRQKSDEIGIFLDGKDAGPVDTSLSRLDVYEAIPRLMHANVGFRLEIDFRALAPGPHVLHVVFARSATRLLLGRRDFRVAARFTDMPGAATGDRYDLDELPPVASDPAILAALDHPLDGSTVLYNPFAAEWQRFREFQVARLLGRFAELALEAGLPQEKLFSHQIMSELEGSWNYNAFAANARQPANSPFKPGLDLYGGACTYPEMTRFTKGLPYGVPEFHPRVGKGSSRQIFLDALELHRNNGAAFVCPYYMTLFPCRPTSDLITALLINPLNPSYGSHFFFSALTRFLNGA